MSLEKYRFNDDTELSVNKNEFSPRRSIVGRLTRHAGVCLVGRLSTVCPRSVAHF